MDLVHSSTIFPKQFLWGASSSSFQFEGAMKEGGRGPSVIDGFRLNDSVTDFEHGSNHYHLWKEDIALANEAGLKSYRFSISWTRIFPHGSGAINPEGIRFYDELINELIKYKIEPVVTIYHFDYPQGLVDEYGGWTNRRSIEDYVNYCRFLFETYGDRVKYWLTINEQDHVFRIAPRLGLTGKEENFRQLQYQANHHMCVASARAFALCREMIPGAKIGPALSYMPIYPATSAPQDIMAAADMESLMMSYLCELQCRGKYGIRFMKYLSDRNAVPDIQSGDMELMRDNPPDFLGINYYTTICVEYNPPTVENVIGRIEGALIPAAEYGIYKTVKNPHLPMSKFGWAIDASGIRLLLENLYERYNLPLMITENGLGALDNFENKTVKDDYRIAYLQEHLKQIHLAMATGVEVIGYNLWSFIDLVSGREGSSKRYGLVYVNRDEFDLKDMKRYKKDSFYWYQKIIESDGASLY